RRLPGSHRLWRPVPRPSTGARLAHSPGSPPTDAPQPRRTVARRFGLLPVRSPLLGESRLFSSPRGTEMFQFPRFASRPYLFRTGCVGMTPRGFPHSGIHGSQPACGSPWLFAACHALPRFLAPRHPPSALLSLTTALARDRATRYADVSRRRSGFSRISPMRLSQSWARAGARAAKNATGSTGGIDLAIGPVSPPAPISLERR